MDFLDVGHGSCVVVRTGTHTCVVDLGRNQSMVWEWLCRHADRPPGDKITLDAVVVTHFHEDHFGGLGALLSDESIDVKALYIHDPQRLQAPETGNERKLSALLGWWCARTGREVVELIDGGLIEFGETTCTAIWPRRDGPEMAGPNENRRSIVLRVDCEGRGDEDGVRVLLTGDADRHVFATITSSRCPSILTCDVLLFPHHGGGCGDDRRSQTFASLLGQSTNATGIVIQNGARYGKHPHPSILAGLRTLPGRPSIACTQLAKECGIHPDETSAIVCAGTITLNGSPEFAQSRDDHAAFVDGLRSKEGEKSAQCRFSGAAPPGIRQGP